ncbi:hypothetical protein SEA_CHRIS_88 [Mycobacterium phage Chris]|uniref:Uncharacterized protein n=1 Tax=Mycobacterium phage Chris TaxID=2725626 RepID=A0A6M3SZ48_9CAUD|nr:hypothetical protein I5G96_gp017 [Mycobacterium phage Chris]QJD50490.1 hypothetical protein SEA_CHRIS_88 [Mycobacterium phage Chris]
MLADDMYADVPYGDPHRPVGAHVVRPDGARPLAGDVYTFNERASRFFAVPVPTASPLDGLVGQGGGLPLGPLYAIPEGFVALGHITEDGIKINHDNAGDVPAWEGKTINTRRTATLTLPMSVGEFMRPPVHRTAAERLRRRSAVDDQYAIIMRLLFGLDVRPARPTVGEALVDLWDAFGAVVVVVAAVVSDAGRAIVARLKWWAEQLVESGEDLVDDTIAEVLDRWDVVRTWVYRRTSGPVVRLWSSEFVHVYTYPVEREPWRKWARRQLGWFGAVWRG